MARIDGRAATTDLLVDLGEDLEFQATIKTPAGVVIDITNDTVEWLVSDAIGGTQITKVTNAVGDHDTPASGTTSFALEQAAIRTDASATADTTWFYTLHWKSSTGKDDIAAFGRVLVRATSSATIA